MIRTPIALNTASNPAVNFVSRSRIRNNQIRPDSRVPEVLQGGQARGQAPKAAKLRNRTNLSWSMVMVVVKQRSDECRSIQQGAYCRDGDGRTGQVPGPLSAPRLGLPENSAGKQDRAERHGEQDRAAHHRDAQVTWPGGRAEHRLRDQRPTAEASRADQRDADRGNARGLQSQQGRRRPPGGSRLIFVVAEELVFVLAAHSGPPVGLSLTYKE
jgi:hypothetical protein